MERRARWIHGPIVDLALLAFGWLPIYALFLRYRGMYGHLFSCDEMQPFMCPPPVLDLFWATTLITRIHRHYSLPLAYGDARTFAKNAALYRWAPLVIAAVVFPACAYRLLPKGPLASALYGVYVAVSMLGGVWNVYHVVMQKYGFLRIYAAKLGHGDAKLDKLLLLSWILLVAAISANVFHEAYFDSFARRGFGWSARLHPFVGPLAGALLVPTIAFAGYVTYRWLAIERRHLSVASIPRLAFAASVGMLLAVFAQSPLLGFLSFAFSHALEYSVFVNLYARRKYGGEPARALRFWARWSLTSNIALVGAMLLLYRALGWQSALGLVASYGLFSSLLHFLYDGLLWKMSDREVRELVLDL